MKRKILLSLALITIMMCLLAISVTASDRTGISYTDINGVTHNVPVVKYEDATAETVASKLGNNATMQALFIDNGAYAILKATDGSLTAYPSWYIIEPSGSSADYVAISEIEYGYVNAMSGKTYNEGAILYIEFPEGMTHLRGNSVFGGSNNKYEINVTEIVIPTTVIAAQSNCFNGAPSLEKVFIKEGSQLAKIEGGSFTDSKQLTYIQFENLSHLESIDGVSNCNLTGKIDLSRNIGLKSIPDGFLTGNSNITEIALPDSIETIGNNVFNGCTNIRFSSPYLPKNLISIGTYFMTNCKNINETLIFPEGFTTITDEGFTNASIADVENGTLNLVFLGEPTKLILDGSSYTGWAKYVNVYFAKYTISDFNGSIYAFSDKEAGLLGGKTTQLGKLEFDVASLSPTSTSQVLENHMRFFFCGENGKVQVSYMLTNAGTDITEDRGTFVIDGHTHYGACTLVEATCGADGSEIIACIICDTEIITHLEATGNHNYVDGVCTVCDNTECPGGTSHILNQEMIYLNGFMNKGMIANKCQNEGCTYEEKISEVDALFTCLGYSAPEDGIAGIAIGFTVNNEAIAKYEEVTGKTLKYGVFAVLQSKLGDNDVFAQDGTVAEGVINAEITNYEFVAFELKIVGFTDKYKDTKLAMGAYVAETDGEATEYSYMQPGTPAENEKYCFVSYNDIVPTTSSEDDEASQ